MKLKTTHISLLTGVAATALLSGCANFQLTSMPDANILENGEVITQTPYKFIMNHGERDFTLQKDGYVQQDITISSLDEAKINIKLEKVDKTPLITKPSSATIINTKTGEELGLTPTEFKLDRPLTVTLSKEGYVTEEVNLIPNRSHRIDMRPIEGWQPIMAQSVELSSIPSGAKVIDSNTEMVLGTTPFTRTIDFGTDITFIKDGFANKSIRVTKSTPKDLTVQLSTMPVVTINSEAGAEIYRLGGLEKIGTVPFTTNVLSALTIELHKDGFYPKTITLTSKSSRNLNVPLKAQPYITLTTQPAGATLYRLGGLEKIGTTPYKSLIEYERVFEIRHPGYKSKVIAIGPDSPAKLNVDLERLHSDAAAVSDSLMNENTQQF